MGVAHAQLVEIRLHSLFQEIMAISYYRREDTIGKSSVHHQVLHITIVYLMLYHLEKIQSVKALLTVECSR